jgi:SAM-dependent methyltransferase
MNINWDEHADGWDENPNVRKYADHAFASLIDAIDCEGLRIFDFGCGTGLLTEKIARNAAAVVALDPAPKMLDVLARKTLTNVAPVAGLLTSDLIARTGIQRQVRPDHRIIGLRLRSRLCRNPATPACTPGPWWNPRPVGLAGHAGRTGLRLHRGRH